MKDYYVPKAPEITTSTTVSLTLYISIDNICLMRFMAWVLFACSPYYYTKKMISCKITGLYKYPLDLNFGVYVFILNLKLCIFMVFFQCVKKNTPLRETKT